MVSGILELDMTDGPTTPSRQQTAQDMPRHRQVA
jgi:hypothetical protein